MTLRMFLLVDLPSGLIGAAATATCAAAVIAWQLLVNSHLTFWPF